MARLDLVRLRVWPPAWLGLIGFNVYILVFMSYGHSIHNQLGGMEWFQWLVNLSPSKA